MTVDEFLIWAETAPGRHELIDGVPVAMASNSQNHSVLQVNIAYLIKLVLGRGPCRTLIGAGIRRGDRSDQWYEADVAVSSTPQPGASKWQEAPVVVVEILSSSTAEQDRGTKVPDYQAIDSVQDILLVSSEKRRVSHWTRQQDGWFVRDIIGAGAFTLQGVPVTMSMDAIYEQTDL